MALLERWRSYISANPSPSSRKPTKSTCAASAGNRATSTTWAVTRSRTSGAASSKRSAPDRLRLLTTPRRLLLRFTVPSVRLRLRGTARARPSPGPGRPHRSGTHGTVRQRLNPRTMFLSRRRKYLQVINRSLPPKPKKVKPIPVPKPFMTLA